MVNRDVTFNGKGLVADLGLHYSAFSEELPQPKVNVVSIPYGTDIDITETLGPVAFENGTHTLVFMAYGDTEAERLAKVRRAIALLNGVRSQYSLSWDVGYTYTGRAKVSVSHVFEHADVITIKIDRAPVKRGDSVTLSPSRHDQYGTYTNEYYELSGSSAYEVTIQHRVPLTVYYGGATVATYEQKTYMVNEDPLRLTGDKTLRLNITGWSWNVYDGSLRVATAESTYGTGSNMELDSSVWTLSGTDMASSGYEGKVVVKLVRLDM